MSEKKGEKAITPKKKPKKKRKEPFGRPTSYKKKYVKQMLKFFNTPQYEKVPVEEIYNDDGVLIKTKYKVMGAKLPFLSAFARSINSTDTTLRHWAYQKNKEGEIMRPDFLRAYKECKKIQKELLIGGGLSGLYNATSYIFTAKNITDMRDKVEVDNTHKLGAMSDEELDNKILDKVMKLIK